MVCFIRADDPIGEFAYLFPRARNLPLFKCFIHGGWDKGGMAQVTIARRHINGNTDGGKPDQRYPADRVLAFLPSDPFQINGNRAVSNGKPSAAVITDDHIFLHVPQFIVPG